jgi:hypothetical protein
MQQDVDGIRMTERFGIYANSSIVLQASHAEMAISKGIAIAHDDAHAVKREPSVHARTVQLVKESETA